MMSTELLIAAVVEPAGARPGSGDLLAGLDKSQGASFAESFSERVGESVLLQKNSSSGDATTTSSGLKGALPGKISDEVAGMPDGLKGQAAATLKVSASGELKSGGVSDKIVPPQAAVVTGAPEKTVTGDPGLRGVQPSRNESEATDNVPPDSVPLQATAGLTDERIVPHSDIPNEDRTQVSSGDGIVVQKELETTGEMKEGVSAKKTAKMQGSTATAKTAPHTAAKIGPMAAVKIVGADKTATSGSATSPSMEGAIPGVIPVVQAFVTDVAVPQSRGGKTVEEGLSEAVSNAAKTSPGGAPTVDASVAPVRKDVAHDTKPTAIDAGSGVPFTEDQLASLKSGVAPEKVAAVAMPASTDSGGKTQSAPGPAMGQIHLMTEVSPVNASGVAMSGNTKGDLTAEKPPVAEASMHAAGLSVGTREQDGPSIVAASMDGTPRMLTATPTALEVGIQSGTHGWLKVRAEMADSGVVNASVSAASSAGQEMLHREIPAMTAYLQEEKVAVNAIVVHAPLASGAESGSSTGTNGTGGQTPQRNSEGGEQQQNVRKAISNGSDEAMTYQSSHGMDEDGSLSLVTYASGGNWLSVRA
jgi:hypothetical protein